MVFAFLVAMTVIPLDVKINKHWLTFLLSLYPLSAQYFDVGLVIENSEGSDFRPRDKCAFCQSDLFFCGVF
jgi:hypothetical protein